MVVEVIGWSEVGNNRGVAGFRQHCAWGGRKKIRASVHKTEATS